MEKKEEREEKLTDRERTFIHLDRQNSEATEGGQAVMESARMHRWRSPWSGCCGGR